MSTSVCQKFNCPFWSKGRRSAPDAPTGGRGCRLYGNAFQCMVSQVAGVSATPYELFYQEEKASPNRKALIELGIKYLAETETADWQEG